MKVLILLSLATLACASIYELPVVKRVVVKHVDADLLDYDEIPSKVHHVQPLQSLSYHPALSIHHYPVKKYTVQYPKGLYHGPHGLGIYNPKLHDELEQAYYRG